MGETDPRLVRLRVELFTAAQTLKGENLTEFWKLIDDVVAIDDRKPAADKRVEYLDGRLARILAVTGATLREPEAVIEEWKLDAVRFKEDHANACKTIAEMHAAAVGEVCGPKRGIVEDVADLRARCIEAEGKASAHWERVAEANGDINKLTRVIHDARAALGKHVFAADPERWPMAIAELIRNNASLLKQREHLETQVREMGEEMARGVDPADLAHAATIPARDGEHDPDQQCSACGELRCTKCDQCHDCEPDNGCANTDKDDDEERTTLDRIIDAVADRVAYNMLKEMTRVDR